MQLHAKLYWTCNLQHFAQRPACERPFLEISEQSRYVSQVLWSNLLWIALTVWPRPELNNVTVSVLGGILRELMNHRVNQLHLQLSIQVNPSNYRIGPF